MRTCLCVCDFSLCLCSAHVAMLLLLGVGIGVGMPFSTLGDVPLASVQRMVWNVHGEDEDAAGPSVEREHATGVDVGDFIVVQPGDVRTFMFAVK